MRMTYAGFSYTVRRVVNENTIWRCEHRTCYGAAKTCKNTIVVTRDHNHISEMIKAKVKMVRSEIKNRAFTTVEKPRVILNTILSGENQNLSLHLPKVKNLVHNITKIRRENNNKCIQEASLIDDFFTKTLSFEKYLVATKTDVKGAKILIYSTYMNLIHLENSLTYVCDGTFYSCPKEFSQIYTIQGLVKGKFYNLVHCFMEKMDTASYKFIFEFIKSKVRMQPQNIIVDYEIAPINIISTTFFETRVNGCFFHLTQTFWRRIQKDGYSKIYKENCKFNLDIKMIIALCFVPDYCVEKDFCILLEYFLNTNTDKYVVDFLFWFENNYICNNSYIKIDKLGVKYFIWSFFSNVVSKKVKTSNSLEGWHRSLNAQVSCKNPNFFEVFKILQCEQNILEVKLLQNLYTSNYDCALESKLFKVCVEYDAMIGIEYLKAIGYNLNLKFE
jgi:hypothetical protein